jgi:hypothetical protein
MAQQSNAKGNPAHTRMANTHKKANRARSWERAQKKKERNRQENEAAARRNKKIRDEGGLTPHELKKVQRQRRRDFLRSKNLLPPIGTTRAQWEASGKYKRPDKVK